MDLRAYYSKLREIEAGMPAPQVVVVSLATPDGGKPGVTTEVPTPIGARMVVEGSARQATEAEAAAFHEEHAAARQAAQDAAMVQKLQVVVVPASAPSAKTPNRCGKDQ
ncbi:MAG TPA: hypothetical protein VGL72_19300 [Bryobacteraceae bacterium]|jgi:hypothetical protein